MTNEIGAGGTAAVRGFFWLVSMVFAALGVALVVGAVYGVLPALGATCLVLAAYAGVLAWTAGE